MSDDQMHIWLTENENFQMEYQNLLLYSVSSQFQSITIKSIDLDWDYLLKCASVFSFSKKSLMQDIALRISHFCLQLIDVTTSEQKSSAHFILNMLANQPSIKLAQEKGLLKEEINAWERSFVGNLNFIKNEIEHSIWLKDGRKFSVNNFQKAFWEALENNSEISISAPTSAGKSYLIKQWIIERIQDKKNICIVYVVPTRALISEVENDFQSALSENIKNSEINVSSFPFAKFADELKSSIFILTQERLQLLLQRDYKNIDILIVDEAYKLADGDRGILLQHVIERTKLSNPSVKVVYISPMAKNPEILVGNSDNSFSAKFEEVTVNQNLIWATQVRGKKWNLELCYSDKKYPITEITLSSTPSSVGLRLPMIAYELGKSGGSIVYVNGAADAEKLAAQLCDMIGFDNQTDDSGLLDLIELCEKVIHKDYRLVNSLKYGVAFHYGNIPLLIREEIENLFKKGSIKFLVCTSTLVEGVNLPCRNIFIRAPKRGVNNPMDAADFWNLAGRAGRWGKDFQGNIICVDPIAWDAPEKKELKSIEKATELAFGRHKQLIQFIEEGTPRDVASKERLLESMSSYLSINYRTYGSIGEIPWMKNMPTEKVDELDKAVRENLHSEKVPEEIIMAHPGISLLGMEKLLNYFEEYDKPYENLLVPYASDTEAVNNYVQVFQRMFNRLTNEFTNHGGYLFREAIVTVHWMQGRPIKRIIAERIKVASERESVHTTIREVLQDIETVARYKAPKYIACYNDILKYFLKKVGRVDLAGEIEDITLFLEMGVNTQSHLSLMNLGLSRTSAVAIKEYITSDKFSERDCIEWLVDPNNNWKNQDLPEIVKREIDRAVAIHTT